MDASNPSNDKFKSLKKSMAPIDRPISKDTKTRAELFLETIVVHLGTDLKEPDDEVVKQDVKDEGESDCMYWIGAGGNCRVKVRDQNGHEQVVGFLKEGDHFGELSIIYSCRRSATVQSKNYQALARINRQFFKEVVSEFPEWETALKNKAIKSYRDKKIQFILRMLKRVEYLEKHDDEVLFDLMFSLESKNEEKGNLILSENQLSDALYFVEDGEVEVYTSFEKNEFVLETLYKGSAINYRAIFM